MVDFARIPFPQSALRCNNLGCPSNAAASALRCSVFGILSLKTERLADHYFRSSIPIQIGGNHGIRLGRRLIELNAFSEVAFAVVKVYKATQILVAGSNVITVKVGDRHSASGRFRRSPKLFATEICFDIQYLPMADTETIQIRLLEEGDPPSIAAAFANMGWNKPEKQYRRYLDEQAAGIRTCFVAIVEGQLAGYVTVNWRPTYAGFADLNIPEIQDLNVLTTYRRKDFASRLLDRAEAEVAQRSSVVGIGVGLHPGYNAAQRLYVKRGHVPDGRGITHQNRFVEEGESVALDDDLVLHFTKRLLPE